MLHFVNRNDGTTEAKVLIVAVRVNYVSLQTWKSGSFESKTLKQLLGNISVGIRKLSRLSYVRIACVKKNSVVFLSAE